MTHCQISAYSKCYHISFPKQLLRWVVYIVSLRMGMWSARSQIGRSGPRRSSKVGSPGKTGPSNLAPKLVTKSIKDRVKHRIICSVDRFWSKNSFKMIPEPSIPKSIQNLIVVRTTFGYPFFLIFFLYMHSPEP